MNRVTLIRGSSNNANFERYAARALAVMWNTTDASIIEPLLAPDVCYESQSILEPLRGRDTLMVYLRGKMRTLRNDLPALQPFAELGEFQDRPCLVFAQGAKEPRIAVGLLTVKDDKIQRIDICTVMPAPEDIPVTGIYPRSLDDPPSQC